MAQQMCFQLAGGNLCLSAADTKAKLRSPTDKKCVRTHDLYHVMIPRRRNSFAVNFVFDVRYWSGNKRFFHRRLTKLFGRFPLHHWLKSINPLTPNDL
jgi:hypothetical protein